MHFFRRPALADLGPFSFWLSLPQLITWGSVFYTFSLLMTPLEAELGMPIALGWLLVASLMATAALWVAQRQALKKRH